MLETKRLILRPFKETDASDLWEYLENPEVPCFYSLRIDSWTQALEEALKRASNPQFHLAIVLKEHNKVIGEVEAMAETTSPDATIVDTFSPCWMLNRKYQGQGYAKEAITAFFNYLFECQKARRIYVYTEDYNISCQKLCIKLGMRKEGEFKEFVSFRNDTNGKPIYENTWQYAILKSEWFKKD